MFHHRVGELGVQVGQVNAAVELLGTSALMGMVYAVTTNPPTTRAQALGAISDLSAGLSADA